MKAIKQRHISLISRPMFRAQSDLGPLKQVLVGVLVQAEIQKQRKADAAG